MNAISKVFQRLIFAGACLVGWIVLPMLIVAGTAALVCYALIAELFSSMADEVYSATGESLNASLDRAPADGLYRPIHP